MVDMQPLVLKPISMHWMIEFLDYMKAHTDITERDSSNVFNKHY